MEPWQERVVAERNELSDKCDKLLKFLNTAISVNEEDLFLLILQYDTMAHYLKILNKRISRFKMQ